MDSFIPPIPDDRDPYQYKAESIQKDKRKEENLPQKEFSPKTPFLPAYLFKLFRKFIQFFEGVKEKGEEAEAEVLVHDHLTEMKIILETLKTENRSQDAQFLNQFSQVWHDLLDDSIRFEKTTAWTVRFRSLLKAMQNFPLHQEHTLGYYLTEYAGKTWLPFPYMEMIQKIHKEHSSDPHGSLLTRWIKQIDDLLTE